MSKFEISSEMLNAYVDGELSRTEAAGVARAAANSSELAARIATLREMKAAVIDTVPPREISIAQEPRPRALGLRHAMAAMLLLGVLAGAVYALQPVQTATSPFAAMLQSRHHAWTFPKASGKAAVVPAGITSEGWPPDLTSAKLVYAGQERMALQGTDIIRTGYEGTRGCKLSLYVMPAHLLPHGAEFLASLHVKSWEIADHGFLLMADGMPRARFRDIALALERSLRSGDPFDATTRQRLAQARRTSPPCRA